MKDTQGNIITEKEFTKDIGHRAEHSWCCATQENEGKCNCKLIVNKEDTWQERFDELIGYFKRGGEDSENTAMNKMRHSPNSVLEGEIKSFIKTEIDKAYKLGMCVGVTEEQERWSEIVKMIKEKHNLTN